MNRLNYILLFLLFISINAFGTHNRAGEITYRHISGYTFELTVTTYTYKYSPANRLELTVTWGDGTSSVIYKVPQAWIDIPGTDYYFNTYIGTHTYPGAGVYEILMEDPNRNQGVKNIPNSVNTIFSIKTTMLIGSDIGANNTPVLLNPPIDKAAKGHIFIHNPAAYDFDGDSLSYAITVCTGEGGQPIEGYFMPPASVSLAIDSITGDLKWETPAEVGVYNIAILVEEWRKNIRIGRIERDMQIDVYESDNNPPENPEIPDYCIEAGDTIDFSIKTTDADYDQVAQEMEGGPFQVPDSAVFIIDSVGYGWTISHFSWITNCSHARQQPYYLVLKSEDINDDISLVDITSFYIRVLHKAPENLRTLAGVDTIRLEWDASNCGNPAGYKVYRRLGYYGFSPDSCENGVPEYTGYELIDIVPGGTVNFYKDDDHDQGLVPGYDYCYMITAYYSDGAESFASHEVCTTLIAGTPPILKVSVANDGVQGEIDLAWAVPIGVDTIDDGPYKYEILRMKPGQTSFSPIATKPTTDLRDTTFIDAGINTFDFPYTYSIILYYYEGGVWYQIPGNETATSQYITIDGADNKLTLTMKKRAPWLNNRYDIYRMNNNTSNFNLIGSSDQPVYVDTDLRNDTVYTYRTIGFGVRPLFGTEYKTENISHIAKGMPTDTIPPCTPNLNVTTPGCDSCKTEGYNYLTWELQDSCKDDEILAFRIYYRNSLEGNFVLVDSLPPNRRSYKHIPDSTIEGYYAVTAIDSSNNESLKNPFPVSNLCGLYCLPNVFTPNGDKINDIYKSWNLNGYIKKVNMTIYNRYGKAVFKTENPDINWDGRNRANGKLVSTGVYYYICDVYEPRITGIVVNNLTGFIHVFSGDDNKKAE